MTSAPMETRAAEPKAKGIREPAYLLRQPIAFWDPTVLNAEQWRRLVGAAPVVRACIQTLILQITGLNWHVESENDANAEYYEVLLANADDGAGFDNLVARVIEDCLTLPFGGVFELGSYPDGTVAWIAHLDAGLMKPTYHRTYPYAMLNPSVGAMDPVLFKAHEVSRVMWQPQTSIKVYGWTRTPAMDCLSAIQGLLRSERFWQSMMTDNPPAGILDVPGWTESEAKDWLEGWKTMMAGIDALKIPVLYHQSGEGDKNAQFITFAKTATEAQLPELAKRYAETICSVHGMNIGDLGLYGQDLRLAGATKLIDLSKRQGLAHLLRRIKARIDNDVLPDDSTFIWEDLELEDAVRRQTARKIGADALVILKNGGIISDQEARSQAIADGLLTIELDEDWPGPSEPAEGEPTGDQAVGTEGDELGDEGRARRFNRRAAGVPPRAFPASSKPAHELGKIVGPWLASIARAFTPARIAQLLDVGLTAAAVAGPGGDKATISRVRTPSPAEQAIEALLLQEEYWHAPDIGERVSRVLKLAYEEGLIEAADDIQRGLYDAKLVGSPRPGVTTAVLRDPKVLKTLDQRAYGLITKVDKGTDHFIRREVMAGVKRGIGSPEIARKLLVNDVRRGVIETFRGRALSIVNTEINAVESEAALRQQLGLGLNKKLWRAVPGVACEMCQRNHDKGAVGPDGTFETVWGDTSDGPPAHPKVCHCWITFDDAELRDVAGAGEPQYWTGQEAAQNLDYDDWTDDNFSTEFTERFGHNLRSPAAYEVDLEAFTRDDAVFIGRMIDVMPRAAAKRVGGEDWPLTFRKTPLAEIQKQFKKAGGYYRNSNHTITLASDYLPAGSKFQRPSSWGWRSGFGEGWDPAKSWTFSEEIVAHEYGHAIIGARFGHARPARWADSIRGSELLETFEQMKAKHLLPSKYAYKNAGEWLAESITGMRWNAVRFMERSPASYTTIQRLLGWDGYVVP